MNKLLDLKNNCFVSHTVKCTVYEGRCVIWTLFTTGVSLRFSNAKIDPRAGLSSVPLSKSTSHSYSKYFMSLKHVQVRCCCCCWICKAKTQSEKTEVGSDQKRKAVK